MAAVACKDPNPVEPVNPDDPDTPTVTPPVALISIDEQTRTSVKFTIASDSPGDYAWAILPADQSISTAEELFEIGNSDMFGASPYATVTYDELKGGSEYNLYYAVRKINPFVYSELKSEMLDTDIPYEDMITLERVTTNTISYHIEKPEGAKAYKHMIVDYNDFLYFQALVGVTHSSYLSAFGRVATESETFDFEWFQLDGFESYPTHFYSDTKYILLAGEVDAADMDAQVSPERVKYLEFTTPKAEECPYKVNMEVSDITSLTAKVTFTPEEGVDRYRACVMSEEDYNDFMFEGEEMLRRSVIGYWDDKTYEFNDTEIFELTNLMPDTKYYACAMAFDEDMREIYIEKIFYTTEPVGPKPEVITEMKSTEEPWNSARMNLKLKNAVTARAFVHTKYAVDEVLNAPGNEDLTMDVVIRNNGVDLSRDILQEALAETGIDMVFSELSPNTEYVYAIMATNSEHVSTVHLQYFTTDAEPVVETTLFGKLKGEYTAKIYDVNNRPYTFDVTITDGVNDATREAYAAENLLVCLGFDACGVDYHSPQDLLDKGWAKTEEEANRNYGPKWFLEIDENEKITTYKHAVASSYYDEWLGATLTDYSAYDEAPMASFNDVTIWFKGTFNRYYSYYDEWRQMATTLIHDVDFNEETGKITVKPVKHLKSFSMKDEYITEYPGVSQSKNWYGGSDEKILFCGGSELTLTKKQTPATANTMKPLAKKLSIPSVTQLEPKKFERVENRK